MSYSHTESSSDADSTDTDTGGDADAHTDTGADTQATPATIDETGRTRDEALADTGTQRDAPQKKGKKRITIYDYDPDADTDIGAEGDTGPQSGSSTQEGTKHTFWMSRLSKGLTADLRKALAPDKINLSNMSGEDQAALENAENTGEILTMVADEDGNVNMSGLMAGGRAINLATDCLYKALEPISPQKSNSQLEQFINEDLNLDQIEELASALLEHSNTSSVKKIKIG